ncbi:SDR family NAD(P)-dependent oxidoreductase [Paracoccus sanguinis]|uniref:NAD(P)-dependent dehydrogenase, short-chain alcohol dehydrogenase family n=1 Tax=Paracoccus sanguinis TaxID=1545044 RepID=A0A1H2XIK7_9RHOB|nr:SDR family NAD(P)-dependent oxidoreductase [Paracoccus sanguinis]KGJ16918.1 3-hydroxyacyl-CoA dehydrogenase [Paracoccus sanguinis]SDW92294.1 NAD(P)-dependent dehydrogenase, short-chain alcohol dehydrogenase family [Paracoccus sanguinis]
MPDAARPLAGRRALITGGGTGVGADLARGFAGAGAEVVVAGRRRDPLDRVAAETGARALTCDVTDEASVAALFEAAGRCDIVIANAGAADSAPFARLSRDQFDAVLAVNLTGTFLTLREGLRRMEGWGRLIAVASTAGLKGYPYVAHYTAAKHGVVGLVRALAQELGPRGITANALCPGFLDTEMTERTLDTITRTTGRDREAAKAALVRANPQRRLVAPSEVTAAALWLCSEGARGVSGQAIAIDGGET